MTDQRDSDAGKPPFAVIPGGLSPPPKSASTEVVSPAPPPGDGGLSAKERRVWDYICDNLRAAGLEHITAGLAIKVISRTYIDWLTEIAACEKEGRYAVSDNGNKYELPHSYNERQHKKDLLKWLPQACLTIPSVVNARAKLGDAGLQDDLFGDLVNQATAARPSSFRA